MLYLPPPAVCVTGLVVVDTRTTFTTFGQGVILILIKIGGLGFMTFGTIVAMLIGKKIYFRERLVLQEALNQASVEGIVRMVRKIIFLTFIMESAGFILLTYRFKEVLPFKKEDKIMVG